MLASCSSADGKPRLFLHSVGGHACNGMANETITRSLFCGCWLADSLLLAVLGRVGRSFKQCSETGETTKLFFICGCGVACA